MEKIKKIEGLHACVPQTMTTENLGAWISDNQKATIQHTDKIPLTDEEISDFEHKSSLASRALDRLKQVEDLFKEYMKEGTPVQDTDLDDLDSEPIRLPMDITIPPTVGTKELKANREYADEILEKGYNEEITNIYMIPYPDGAQMVAVDIEGNELPDYTKPMTEVEKELYGRLFVKDENGQMMLLPAEDVSVSGDTAVIKTKKKAKKEPEQFI